MAVCVERDRDHRVTESTEPPTGLDQVSGEVTVGSEAFCAGLTATLRESESALNPEASDLVGIGFDDCIAQDLAAAVGVPEDADLEYAYAFGCTAVLSNLEFMAGFPYETAFDLAFGVCSKQFSELDPDYLGLEYRITRDGICYPGFGEGAGLQGCLNEIGE